MRWLCIVAVFAFGAGWWVCDLYQDSQQLVIEKAVAAAAVKTDASIAQSAQIVENKMQELKANERHTEKVIRTEIIKPVFNNVCATDDYVRLFNESTARDEKTLSGKSDNEMPD